MLPGPKFRLRRKVWSQSCTELAAVLPEEGTSRALIGSAYKMCLSPRPSRKMMVDQPVWSVGPGWWKAGSSVCGASRESVESGYGDSTTAETLLKAHSHSLFNSSSNTVPGTCSLHHCQSITDSSETHADAFSPKCTYSCQSSTQSFTLCHGTCGFRGYSANQRSKRKDNVVHWKAKVCPVH